MQFIIILPIIHILCNHDLGCFFHFSFLTAILHRGLRNDFFFRFNQFTFSNFYLDFYFPLSIWTFIFPFLFGLLFSLFYLDFSFFPFLFKFFLNSFFILSRSHFGFLPNVFKCDLWVKNGP